MKHGKKKKIMYERRAISVCIKTIIMFTLTTNKIYANFKYNVVGKKMYLLVSSKCLGTNILLYSVVIRGD